MNETLEFEPLFYTCRVCRKKLSDEEAVKFFESKSHRRFCNDEHKNSYLIGYNDAYDKFSTRLDILQKHFEKSRGIKT
jgi:hypothetical protein